MLIVMELFTWPTQLIMLSANSPVLVCTQSVPFIYLGSSVIENMAGCAVGVMTTFVGSGSRGWVDGLGTFVEFNLPAAIAVDSNGNLLIGDYARVRMSTTAGIFI